MTPTTTRSTRIKKPVINNVIGETNKPKQAYVKKKKQLRAKKDNSNTVLEPETHPMNTIDSTHSTIDPSEHPDYIRLMSELEDSKQKRLEKIKMLRDHEHRLILDWFASQKKQLLNEYYFARKKARTSLAEEVQSKLVKIRQESNQLNKQSKTQYSDCDYSDWVPPERLHTIDILFLYNQH
ncbi:hypothetical protein G6F56_010228 [Rhizopus delemar]|nr:hypothetical protein G6F56_010228 [Rhizopus delemar]